MEKAPGPPSGRQRPRPWLAAARAVWDRLVDTMGTPPETGSQPRPASSSLAPFARPLSAPPLAAPPLVAPAPVAPAPVAPPVTVPHPVAPPLLAPPLVAPPLAARRLVDPRPVAREPAAREPGAREPLAPAPVSLPPVEPPGPPASRSRPSTVHLGLLTGSHASEIALLRAEITRREHEIDQLRSALSQVLGRFAELTARRASPQASATARSEPARDDDPVTDDDPPPEDEPLSFGNQQDICAKIEETTTNFAGRWSTAPLVTVVLLTTQWPEHDMEAAVASVVAQTYPWWELLVVDDRRSGGPPPSLGGGGDGRIRVLAGPGCGPVAARRRALQVAEGQLVAYVGDETLMAPGWLGSVAWASSRTPEADAFLGRGLTVLDPGLTVLDPPVPDPAAQLVRLCRAGRVRLDSSGPGPALSALAHRCHWPVAALGEGMLAPLPPGTVGPLPPICPQEVSVLAYLRKSRPPAHDNGAGGRPESSYAPMSLLGLTPVAG